MKKENNISTEKVTSVGAHISFYSDHKEYESIETLNSKIRGYVVE